MPNEQEPANAKAQHLKAIDEVLALPELAIRPPALPDTFRADMVEVRAMVFPEGRHKEVAIAIAEYARVFRVCVERDLPGAFESARATFKTRIAPLGASRAGMGQ
jgi:hypothetical protein